MHGNTINDLIITSDLSNQHPYINFKEKETEIAKRMFTNFCVCKYNNII